jgi:hypothetical protein
MRFNHSPIPELDPMVRKEIAEMFPSNREEESSSNAPFENRPSERGAALVTALIILALLLAISASVLAVVTAEANIAGSDLRRTRAYYAASASLEKMTTDFSALFTLTAKPTQGNLDTIMASYPSELTTEGFTFSQSLKRDDARLTAMRSSLGLTDPNAIPTVNLTTGPFAGLYGSVTPYKLISTATYKGNEQVSLQREINNYLIPLFQFGMFTDGDMELHPGPAFYFNGRVHANGNFYINGPNDTSTNYTNFTSKVTIAKEAVYDVLRNGTARTGRVKVWVGGVSGIGVVLDEGSVKDGPNKVGAAVGARGYNIGSPNGTVPNPDINWDTTSLLPAVAGTDNQFGGQFLTGTTGAVPLKLPFQLDGASTREIIKRATDTDTDSLKESRYHTKAQIRILLDDDAKVQAGQSPGWPSTTAGVLLDTFVPTRVGADVLRRFSDAGVAVGATVTQQGSIKPAATPVQRYTSQTADAVRGVAGALGNDTTAAIPTGAPLSGRILIQIIDTNGNAIDVTQAVLSMGITEGEPNGIVYLQRPLWAAFMQGSRDRDAGTGTGEDLADLINTASNNMVSDGEIANTTAAAAPTATPPLSATTAPTLATTPDSGYMAAFTDDADGTIRAAAPPTASTDWNRIVPINMYNVREGWISQRLDKNQIYERGVTSVVEINMKNFSRWVYGFYDGNLLAGASAAQSGNIKLGDGYILYVSDRRGDAIQPGASTTNGIADNEDIYIFRSDKTGNAVLGQEDPGEDVNDDNALSTDSGELPYPLAGNSSSGLTGNVTYNGAATSNFTSTLANLFAISGNSLTWGPPSTTSAASTTADKLNRSRQVLSMNVRAFRRSVRLFNGEDLQPSFPSLPSTSLTSPTKLSINRGISVATENMVYVWGNYNTTGITCQPSVGSTLNEISSTSPTATAQPCRYKGDQVPASIVSDAVFPLSKTWADSLSAMYPEASASRDADASLPTAPGAPTPNYETSVRAGIIAGNNLSALAAGSASARDAGNGDAANNYESRLNGGMHNFPRFLEDWGSTRWNFVGALIPLYNSTQAVGPYDANGAIYGAPIRNWAFDDTFKDPNRLPPGTPQFQYIEPTGFRLVIGGI